MKYEVGGQVKISGKWYDIYCADTGSPTGRDVKVSLNGCLSRVFNDFIEDYRPPTKEEPTVFEWLSNDDILTSDFCFEPINTTSFRGRVNKYLTEKYGDPAVRVYNGEDAEQFGLHGDSYVLYFGACESWEGCEFRHLSIDDIWRKPPPPPEV